MLRVLFGGTISIFTLLTFSSFTSGNGPAAIKLRTIVIDPDILVGKPVVKGTRLSVDLLLGLLAQGWAASEILRNDPGP